MLVGTYACSMDVRLAHLSCTQGTLQPVPCFVPALQTHPAITQQSVEAGLSTLAFTLYMWHSLKYVVPKYSGDQRSVISILFYISAYYLWFGIIMGSFVSFYNNKWHHLACASSLAHPYFSQCHVYKVNEQVFFFGKTNLPRHDSALEVRLFQPTHWIGASAASAAWVCTWG